MLCNSSVLSENQSFCYYNSPINDSNLSFDHCWMKVDSQANSTRLTSSNPDLVYSVIETNLGGVISTILSICGILLNSVIIFGIARSPDLRQEYLTPTIISIALTDLIYSIINLPIQANFFFKRDQPVGCDFYNFCGYVLWFCSAFNLLVIAILRVIAVSFPKKLKNPYSPMAHSKKILPIFAWIFSAVLWIPTLTQRFGRFGVECKSFICKPIPVDIGSKPIPLGPEEGYSGLILLCGILVLVLNIVTFVQMRKRTRQILKTYKSSFKETQGLDTNELIRKREESILKKERNIGKFVARITGSFFIVYFPYIIVRQIDPNFLITRPITSIIVNALTNSLVVIDPLMYIVANKTYLRQIRNRVHSLSMKKSTKKTEAS